MENNKHLQIPTTRVTKIVRIHYQKKLLLSNKPLLLQRKNSWYLKFVGKKKFAMKDASIAIEGNDLKWQI